MAGPPRTAFVAGAMVVLLAVGALVLVGGGRGPSTGRPAPASVPALSSSPVASPVATPSPSIGAGPLDLAIVALDGTLRQDLGLPHDAWSADLSPDGSRVVFSTADQSVGSCGGCADIRRPAVVDIGATRGAYVYPTGGTDGSAIVDPSTFSEFAWSPDGKHIAVQAKDGSGNLDIYVVDIDMSQDPVIGGTVRRLTTDPAVDEFPAWSPDGSTIVYSNVGASAADDSGFSPTQEIWRVPAAGGTPRRLTDNDVAETMPDVAADGTIAYWSGGQIRTMALDGTGVRQLVPDAPGLARFNPRWSPDGSKVALLEYDPSQRATIVATGLPGDLPLLKVLVIDLASGDVTDVGTWRVAGDFNPVSWTPDGQALLIDRYDAGP